MALSKPLKSLFRLPFSNSTTISQASGDVVLRINSQTDQQGGTQTPPVLQNVTGIPVVHLGVGEEEQLPAMASQESLGIPPAPLPPNHDQVQAPPHENVTQEETEGEAQLNRPKLSESYLVFVAQVAVSFITVWSSNANHPLPRNATILRDFAAGSNIVGYIACFTSMLMCRDSSTGLAARILSVIGYAGAAFGFLGLMGMLLPDNLKLWVTFVACSACLPAIASAIRH